MPISGRKLELADNFLNNMFSYLSIYNDSMDKHDSSIGNGTEFEAPGNGSVFVTPIYVFVWVTVANILVFVTGIVGNVLVILVVMCVRDMKTATNICLMNLSVADLLVLIICQPSALLDFYAQERWMLGEAMCKLVYFLENTVTLASILIIVIVSLERYFAVCFPLQMYSTVSRTKVLVIMASVWVVAVAFSSPFLFLAYTDRVEHLIDKEIVEVCRCETDLPWQYMYLILNFVFVFAIPLSLLIFLYSRIIIKVVVDRMDGRQLTDKARVQMQRSRQQLVVMLIGIILLFFICLLPFRISVLQTIHQSIQQVEMPPAGHEDAEVNLNLVYFGNLLIYINSAGNPIIYNMVSSKFRRAFARVLFRLGCRCRVIKNGVTSENGTLRRSTVTHYMSVQRNADDGPTDTV